MAKPQTNRTQAPKTQGDDHLLVSVMPKEFRGLEGLKRPVMGEPVQRIAPPEPPAPPPKPKTVTPAAAKKGMPLPPAKKPFPILPVVVGVVVILLVTGGGIVALLTLSGPEEAVETPEVRPPIVVTDPPDVSDTPNEDLEEDPVSPFGEGIFLGLDTDSDGLTDVEEAMYGTQVTRPDTDGDGFLDGNEVFHLYHPDGREPLRLIDTGDVEIIDQPTFAFTLYAPTSWTVQANTSEQQIVMVAPTGESLQVVRQDIDVAQTLRSWYLDNTSASQQVPLESFRTKQGFVAAWTDDHLTAYVRFDDVTVLIFTYNLGNENRVEYRQTFEMVLNSLVKRP